MLLPRPGLMAVRRVSILPRILPRIQPVRFYVANTPRPVRPVRAKPPQPNEEQQKKDEKNAQNKRRINLLILLGTLAAATTLARKYFGSERRKYTDNKNVTWRAVMFETSIPLDQSSTTFCGFSNTVESP